MQSFTARDCTIATKKSSYNPCTRTTCNWFAANAAAMKLKSSGWNIPSNTSDLLHLRLDKTDFVDPFMTQSPNEFQIPYAYQTYGCYGSYYNICYVGYYWTYVRSVHAQHRQQQLYFNYVNQAIALEVLGLTSVETAQAILVKE